MYIVVHTYKILFLFPFSILPDIKNACIFLGESVTGNKGSFIVGLIPEISATERLQLTALTICKHITLCMHNAQHWQKLREKDLTRVLVK